MSDMEKMFSVLQAFRTNEALWRTYFREPANKEKCKDSCGKDFCEIE